MMNYSANQLDVLLFADRHESWCKAKDRSSATSVFAYSDGMLMCQFCHKHVGEQSELTPEGRLLVLVERVLELERKVAAMEREPREHGRLV